MRAGNPGIFRILRGESKTRHIWGTYCEKDAVVGKSSCFTNYNVN